MSIKCLIDNSVHENIESLHNLLKRFRIRQSDYYHEYLPRYNVATGKLIPYKNYDQYFSQDLEDKNELKAWIKNEPARAKEWAINWLKLRKEEKNLKYAPSQVELRTLLCPSMPYYDANGGYYNITKQLGYEDRYQDGLLTFTPLPKDISIIQDTREQNPLKLSFPIIEQKIDSGDYALPKPYDKGIYVERKSLSDFAGTMSKGNERFRKELARAVKKGHYIVMLVESSISDANGIKYLPQTRHVRATSTFLFKQMRDLLIEFSNSFQILFVDGRVEASQKLIKIFELGEQVKITDLQNKYEKGEL